MGYTAVDCLGFGGGFTLGMVQAGFELQAKLAMKDAFGVANCEANRALLGDGWRTQISEGRGDDWDPPKADVLFGNPPCSGFSSMSRADFRGIDSPINHCMWAFAGAVPKVDPLVAVFESVQAASKLGYELMHRLRAQVEERTGHTYTLYHVLHNNAAVGGGAIRRRYFWLISRIPFGVERTALHRLPTLHDVIGDLEGLGNSWELQPYRRPPTWWSRQHVRSRTGLVDGMKSRTTWSARRTIDLIPGAGWDWKETLEDVARRHYELHGRLPDSWRAIEGKLVARDFRMGVHLPNRWHPDRMARVVTGAGPSQVIHPYEDRFITQRETARIQGFPDDWTIRGLKYDAPGLTATWGKGIPVTVARWIGHWVIEALEGRPGSYIGRPGEPGQRERWIDVGRDWWHLTPER